ncbi:MAG: hypothetical protein LBQ58_04650 [Synergistaceae bacterium]|jgi:hypothetical protein|nr:hypothetical protein [Synergistaceae bacterium]
MTWKIEYTKTKDNIYVGGYSSTDAYCRMYFSSRVSSKIAESDGTEHLKAHLTEMLNTGFDTSTLLLQVSESPQIKDWEVGEAFAEVVLEDEHEVMFPWETGWDKRSSKASLPGPDILGLQSKKKPRFVFGQVKSSSEKHVPPQVVNSGRDCLREQMRQLCHSFADRQQLLEWLLLRMKGTEWEPVFNEALRRYANKDYWLSGILVSGGRSANEKDLSSICVGIGHEADDGEISLLAYYLPFERSEWPKLLTDRKETL